MKQSSLLGQFVSYEENGVLWIRYQGLYSKNFISFLIREWAQQGRVLLYIVVEGLALDKRLEASIEKRDGNIYNMRIEMIIYLFIWCGWA